MTSNWFSQDDGKKATISRATVANLELNGKIGSGFLSFGLYFIIGISESSWNFCSTETDSVWLQLMRCCTACASWALCPRGRVLSCGRAHGGSASCPPGSARAKPNSLWESRKGCPEPLHSFVALATASSFLSCFYATGTAAHPRAAATSCCDLLSLFPVMQSR